jgi:heme-degrading monooxygenase HmoA
MPSATVRLSVKDFDQWKTVFEEAGGLRKSFGSRGVTAFRSLDQQSDVVILGDYADLARARQLFQSDEFRSATQRAGVTAPPQVTFADEVLKLPA